jgi:hypothetical protein
VTNKQSKNKSEIDELMEKRRKLKKKESFDEKEELELNELEKRIAEKCEEMNRKKVTDNFKDIQSNQGNVSHQGIWSIKRKYFPKKNPSLPAGKKSLKHQLITNPAE